MAIDILVQAKSNSSSIKDKYTIKEMVDVFKSKFPFLNESRVRKAISRNNNKNKESKFIYCCSTFNVIV